MKQGSQADLSKIAKQDKVVIAYMPPATEFNYYMAIGEGIKAAAKATPGVETFMLAPQSAADINGQMGMIQDTIQKGVSAIILSTHDEAAAAPLVQKAVDKGIAVVIVNSDIADFPTPVDAVVGYSQRAGTKKLGEYFLGKLNGAGAKIGIIEGQPGYHSTERVGGFVDAVKSKPGIEIKASVPGGWNVEGAHFTAATGPAEVLPSAPRSRRGPAVSPPLPPGRQRWQYRGDGPSSGQPGCRHSVRGQRLYDHGRSTGCQVAGPSAEIVGQ